MSEQQGSHDTELLAKSRRGTLSNDEKWELIQRSLSNDELFEALAADGIMDAGLSDPKFQEAPVSGRKGSIVRFVRWATLSAAAAAAIFLAAIYLRDPESPRRDARLPPPSALKETRAVPKPVLGPVAGHSQPILLALRLASGRNEEVSFRGDAPSEREPTRSGTLLSIVDGVVSVNLGWVDGVAEGAVLPVRRHGREVAAVKFFIVLREESRARLTRGGPIEIADTLDVTPATHLTALWERATILSGRKQHSEALRRAADAIRFAEMAKLETRMKLRSEQYMAEAEFKAGDTNAAKQRLKRIVETARGSLSPLELLSAYEALGVISLLEGDLAEARVALNESARLTAVVKAADAHARALNNLGVLAELRGDVMQAARLFEQARQQLAAGRTSSTGELRVVEQNLVRLGSPR